MKPQLTLQTPLELPYQEITNYLNELWMSEDKDNTGASTFTLTIWQPAWLEQCLVQKGLVNGPITGNLSPEIIEAAKKFILDAGLPITTSLNSEELLNLLEENLSNEDVDDFRGQFFESSISTLNPRRLITLAPTLNNKSEIKTFVSAFCPLSDSPGMQPICGDLVVIRGDSSSINNKGLKIIDELSINELPSWLWWNGSLDESSEIFRGATFGIRNQKEKLDKNFGEKNEFGEKNSPFDQHVQQLVHNNWIWDLQKSAKSKSNY